MQGKGCYNSPLPFKNFFLEIHIPWLNENCIMNANKMPFFWAPISPMIKLHYICNRISFLDICVKKLLSALVPPIKKFLRQLQKNCTTHFRVWVQNSCTMFFDITRYKNYITYVTKKNPFLGICANFLLKLLWYHRSRKLQHMCNKMPFLCIGEKSCIKYSGPFMKMA